MVIDVYLQIDGIKGESMDSDHQGWIEIHSASMGVKQPHRMPTAAWINPPTTMEKKAA